MRANELKAGIVKEITHFYKKSTRKHLCFWRMHDIIKIPKNFSEINHGKEKRRISKWEKLKNWAIL